MGKLKRCIYKHYMILLCFIGVMGSGLFLMIGYWSAGAINGDQTIGFFIRFRNILREPFGDHRNVYTPIVMVISFIVFELIYFLILAFVLPALKHGDADNQEKTKKIQKEKFESHEKETKKEVDIINIYSNKILETEEGFGLFKDDVVSEETMEKNEDSKNSLTKQIDCFDETFFRELFELGYSFEQITEMSKLKNYMESISVDMLVKIFDVTMPAADICSYIELFYE